MEQTLAQILNTLYDLNQQVTALKQQAQQDAQTIASLHAQVAALTAERDALKADCATTPPAST